MGAIDYKPNFETSPDQYRHWQLSFDGPVATLAMNVQEDEGLGDYTLKLNSYDIGVDIELADAIERLRFEHPEIKSVVVTGLKDRVFCSGANIFMLGSSTHAFKVNFCKYTNETRLGIEDASAHSGLKFLAALNGTASGGGYELALACDEILLIDDANSAVSFPEVPLLGVLPGTGGLTRITDKRKIRRDLCDVFSTVAEGIKGKRAVEWNLVDHLAPKSKWDEKVKEHALALAEQSSRNDAGKGVALTSIAPKIDGTNFDYKYVSLAVDEKARTADITIRPPNETEPSSAEKMRERGAEIWVLRMWRELDDAILRLRMHYLDVALLTLRTEGDDQHVLAAEQALIDAANAGDWFANEVVGKIRRVLKRVDVTSKTMLALVEPKSAWTGMMSELLFCADRSYMLDDPDADDAAKIRLTSASFGMFPMGNGLTRLQTRFYGDAKHVLALEGFANEGKAIEPDDAEEHGVVTFVRDDIDYPDEIRLFIEERTSLSSDALTGMEQNLRWPGPETMETRIFGRLSAWQNWIFTRDNATGEKGALTLYGSPTRPEFDPRRC